MSVQTHIERPRSDGGSEPIWLPYSRAELIAIKRCPDCGYHPPTQGHNPKCPTNPSGATETPDDDQ